MSGETSASQRAREILSSLREKREFFESQVALNALRKGSVGNPPSSNHANADNEVLVKPVAVRPLIFTPQETQAIAQQLSFSIQERKSRISRMSGRTPDCLESTLNEASSSKSLAGFASPSQHSTNTAETGELTLDDTLQSSPGDFSLSGRFLDSPSGEVGFPRPPMLHNEVGHVAATQKDIDDKDVSFSSASQRSTTSEESSSSGSCDDLTKSLSSSSANETVILVLANKLSQDDKDQTAEKSSSSNEELSSHQDEKKEELVAKTTVPQHRSSLESPPQIQQQQLEHNRSPKTVPQHRDSLLSPRASVASPRGQKQQNNGRSPIFRNLFDVPQVRARVFAPPTSFDEASRPRKYADTLVWSKDDIELPPGLIRASVSDPARQKQQQKCATAAGIVEQTMTESSSSGLGTEQQRAEYIDQLYNGPQKDVRMLFASSALLRKDATPRQERREVLEYMARMRAEKRRNKAAVSANPERQQQQEHLRAVQEEKIAEKATEGGDGQEEVQQLHISGIALVVQNDDKERRKFLESLRAVLQAETGADSKAKQQQQRIRLVPVSAGDFDLNEVDSIIISEVSSFEASSDEDCDSNTSGWASTDDENDGIGSEEDVLSDIDAVIQHKQPLWKQQQKQPPRRQTTNRRINYVGRRKLVVLPVAIEEEETYYVEGREEKKSETVDEKKNTSIKAPSLMCMRDTTSDVDCSSNGGLYTLALASGMTDDTPIPVKGKGFLVNTRKSGSRGFLCLSTDFRCGAQGSLYDLAVRSGCKVGKGFERKEPSLVEAVSKLQQRAKPVYLSASGGHYYIALESGLSRASLRARRGFTISTTTFRDAASFDEDILPEEVSDMRCGTTGTLYIAQKSGIQYVALDGSMYKIADLARFRFI